MRCIAQVLIQLFMLEVYDTNLIEFYVSDILFRGKIHLGELFLTELTKDDTGMLSKLDLVFFANSNALDAEKFSVFSHLSKWSCGNITGMRL